MKDSTEREPSGRVLSDEEIEEEFKMEMRRDYSDYPGGQGAIFWPLVIGMIIFLVLLVSGIRSGKLPL